MSETKFQVRRRDIWRMFYAVGFRRAANWSDEELREMAMRIEFVNPTMVPDKYSELYAVLRAQAKKGQFLIWDTLCKPKKK